MSINHSERFGRKTGKIQFVCLRVSTCTDGVHSVSVSGSGMCMFVGVVGVCVECACVAWDGVGGVCGDVGVYKSVFWCGSV